MSLALPFLAGNLLLGPLYVVAVLSGVVLWNVSTVLDHIFIAERTARNMLLRNVWFAILRIPLLWLLIVAGFHNALAILSTWLIAMLAAAALAIMILIPGLERLYRPTLRGLTHSMREIGSLLAGRHLIGVGGTLPIYLLPVVVAERLSVVDNAYFYTAWMLGGMFLMVSAAVASALFAEGSYSRQELAQRVGMSAILIIVLLGVASAAFALVGRDILALFGPAYAEQGVPLLVLVIISALPDAVTNIYISILRIQRRLSYAAFFNLGMAVIAVALAWFLVPLLGIWSGLVMVDCTNSRGADGVRYGSGREPTAPVPFPPSPQIL